MILSKEKVILGSIFYMGLLAGLVGNFKIGDMRLQFILSCFIFLVLVFSILKWMSFRVPASVAPVIIFYSIMIITISDKFGFIQALYMFIPLLSFICGSCLKYNDDIFNRIGSLINFNLKILIILILLSVFIGFSQFDSRPLSIYISLMILVSLLMDQSKTNYVISLPLVLFVIFSGARGALFACLISLLIVYISSKLKSMASLFSALILILIFCAFFEKIIYYIFTIDSLRERTFYDGVYDYSKLLAFEFNSSGRDLTWPVYWGLIVNTFNDNQFINVIFGHGYGYASQFGYENFGDKWLHPHNEVLRLLIDFGLFGFFIILFFWFSVVYNVLMNGGDLQKRITVGLASFTIIIMLTDNPLMYPLYYGSICMLLIGICYYSSLKNRV